MRQWVLLCLMLVPGPSLAAVPLATEDAAVVGKHTSEVAVTYDVAGRDTVNSGLMLLDLTMGVHSLVDLAASTTFFGDPTRGMAGMETSLAVGAKVLAYEGVGWAPSLGVFGGYELGLGPGVAQQLHTGVALSWLLPYVSLHVSGALLGSWDAGSAVGGAFATALALELPAASYLSLVAEATLDTDGWRGVGLVTGVVGLDIAVAPTQTLGIAARVTSQDGLPGWGVTLGYTAVFAR